MLFNKNYYNFVNYHELFRMLLNIGWDNLGSYCSKILQRMIVHYERIIDSTTTGLQHVKRPLGLAMKCHCNLRSLSLLIHHLECCVSILC